MTWKRRGFSKARIAAHIFQRVTASCTYYEQPWVTFEAESSSLAVRLTQMAEYAFMKNVFFLQTITQVCKSLGDDFAFDTWRRFSFFHKGSESRINECAVVCANM